MIAARDWHWNVQGSDRAAPVKVHPRYPRCAHWKEQNYRNYEDGGT